MQQKIFIAVGQRLKRKKIGGPDIAVLNCVKINIYIPPSPIAYLYLTPLILSV